MDISAIGLLGRGFKTEVSPAFSLPLDQTKCNNCGMCVSLCPTGALTEKAHLKKQVPLEETYQIKNIDINGKSAEVIVAYYNGEKIRVIPNDDASRNSGLTREELFELV